MGAFEQRVEFVESVLRDDDSISAACERFGISRQKGHKWLKRYEEGGVEALHDRSRRPLSNSRAVPASTVELVVQLRKKRPHWGPRKLLAILERDYPELELPAASTVGDLLRSRGMVRKSRARVPRASHVDELSAFESPNAVWCADFKGQFVVGDRYCHPLTITDGYSRYLLRCSAMRQTLHVPVKKEFESAFREYGLPTVIRTDNGPPFASVTTGGLSRLAVWWIQLGIKPERIRPGHPEQNGRHERMHRTLKQETTKPPAKTFIGQQRVFDVFRFDYNVERPHEALGQQPPAKHYQQSKRSYPRELKDPRYPKRYETRRAYPNGVITVEGLQWYLSGCLANQLVGLDPVADGCWRVYFGPLTLGLLDVRGPVRRNTRDFGLLRRMPDDAKKRQPITRR